MEEIISIDIEPIETKKRYALVIDKILELLEKGAFKINEKLPPERVMAKKLGVSRPSVREAYSALEIAGILESRAGSGTYVKSININNFFMSKIEDISSKEESPYEIIEVRRIIEPEIVALAAKNATSKDIKEIERILGKMKLEIKNSGSYTLETDSLFHIKLAKTSGNGVLLNLMKYIIDLTKEKLWGNIREKIVNIPGHLEHDIKYHEDIVRYIRNKDVKNARSLMRKHFNEIKKEIIQD